jgi:hypothetical protein
VIAEAVFKYAGSVYSNIEAVKATMGGNMWKVTGSAEKNQTPGCSAQIRKVLGRTGRLLAVTSYQRHQSR